MDDTSDTADLGHSADPVTDRAEMLQRFAIRFGDATRLWRIVIDRRLRPLGVSFQQWITLSRLAALGDGIMQKDLAQAVGIEGPTLVGILDRLARAGFLERRVSRHDRRAKTVHLTADGRRFLGDAGDMLHDIREIILDALSEDEVRTCTRAFDHIVAHAEALLNAAEPPR